MLPDLQLLRDRLQQVIICKQQQGYETAGMLTELKQSPESYDALAGLAQRLADLPFRSDWRYSEPNDLAGIWEECDADRPIGPLCRVQPERIADHVKAAFQGAVCGCVLGKPLEINPTLSEIRKAAESCNQWPLRDYISEALLDALGRRHESAPVTTRDNIRYVAPDDDLNYTVLGMLVLEQRGVGFTKSDLMALWLRNLPPLWTFGPERSVLIQAAINSMERESPPQFEFWANEWNPRNELCGAAIRVDAYGYATPGNPALAAELAWRDSSMTHVRTGIYGSMFVAAAISTAFVAQTPLDIFATALKFVPQRSRFYEIVADCFQLVSRASDWLDGYEQIHRKYGDYGHCQLYQECGLLINSARFAEDIPDALCMQVAQGCDTDCFGELIGSIMGAYFGPEYLDHRWLAPFNNDLRTALGNFHERSLSAVAQRMSQLPLLAERGEPHDDGAAPGAPDGAPS
jgi:ADP-ribosylglycohydrolase